MPAQTYPKSGAYIPKLPAGCPDFAAMPAGQLKSMMKFYRHRMGYWRDRAETIAAEVEQGRLDAEVCRVAISECLRTMRYFLAAVEERERRKTLVIPQL